MCDRSHNQEWHESCRSDPSTRRRFAWAAITGTNIGFSDDNFWDRDNSQAYRGNVTSLVPGDGSYALSGFEKPPALANGAALFVFFDDGNAANNRDVVLFNGNDANFGNPFDPDGWDITLSGITYTSGTGALTLYVSDGQNFGPTDDGTLSVNGTPIATGGLFQGLAPRAPGAGVANGSLADISTFDITSFLSPGPNTLNVTLGPGVNDALSVVVAAIDLPAGAAPGAVPLPPSLLLVAAGILTAPVVRRILRRRR